MRLDRGSLTYVFYVNGLNRRLLIAMILKYKPPSISYEELTFHIYHFHEILYMLFILTYCQVSSYVLIFRSKMVIADMLDYW